MAYLSRKMFDLIVAMNPVGIIGADCVIPWHVPEDLAFFRKMTLGKNVIMGRKTFAGLPSQKPLPNRTNLVVTRDENLFEYAVPEATLDTVVKFIRMEDAIGLKEPAFVIGGGEIYQELLPHCDRLYVTIVFWKPDEDENQGFKYFPLTLAQLMMEYALESETEIMISSKNGLNYKMMVFRKR